MKSRLSISAFLSVALCAAPCLAQEAPKKGSLRAEDIGFTDRSSKELAQLVVEGREAEFQIARRILNQRGRDAAADIVPLLSSESLRARETALDLLVAMGGHPQAEDPLLAIFQAETSVNATEAQHQEMRRQAAIALATMQSAKALDVFLTVLTAKPGWLRLRETARIALTRYEGEGAQRVVARTRDAIAAKDASTAGRLLIVLGDLPGDEARDLLLSSLQKMDGETAVTLRHHAAIGLERRGDKATVKPLITQLNRETNHFLQKHIARALRAITGEDLPADPVRWKAWLDRTSTAAQAEGTRPEPEVDLLPPVDISEMIGKKKKGS